MRNQLELPKTGDDPWVEAEGVNYAAVGCGASGIGYVFGYRRAADALFAALKAESWFSPIVRPYLFLWRHYFELHLKRLYFLGKGETAARRHSGLVDLWHQVEPLIPVLPERERLQTSFSGLEHILQRLEQVDPNSTDNRYHQDRRGNPSLENAPRHINVEAFHDVMSRAANLLECIDPLIEFRQEL